MIPCFSFIYKYPMNINVLVNTTQPVLRFAVPAKLLSFVASRKSNFWELMIRFRTKMVISDEIFNIWENGASSTGTRSLCTELNLQPGTLAHLDTCMGNPYLLKGMLKGTKFKHKGIQNCPSVTVYLNTDLNSILSQKSKNYLNIRKICTIYGQVPVHIW